jgi:hypothetical protein
LSAMNMNRPVLVPSSPINPETPMCQFYECL